MIRLLTEKEANEFRIKVRKSWGDSPIHFLESSLVVNERLMQYVTIRNETIREIINERTRGDYKAHQYAD